MTFVKGHKLSPESLEKLRASKAGKPVGPKSDEHKKKIGDALRGKKREKKFHRMCACGVQFSSGASNSKFCSLNCRRASYGHGLRHAPEFLGFPERCAICESQNQLVGDHCHATGRARGLLCRNCNLAIGNMFDSPARLRAAAEYLERA